MDKIFTSIIRKCSEGISNRLGLASTLRGLTAAESDLLMVRMLQELSSRYDIYFDDIEIPGLAGLPQLDELLDKVSSQDAARLLRDEVGRLRSKEAGSYQRV